MREVVEGGEKEVEMKEITAAHPVPYHCFFLSSVNINSCSWEKGKKNQKERKKEMQKFLFLQL